MQEAPPLQRAHLNIHNAAPLTSPCHRIEIWCSQGPGNPLPWAPPAPALPSLAGLPLSLPSIHPLLPSHGCPPHCFWLERSPAPSSHAAGPTPALPRSCRSLPSPCNATSHPQDSPFLFLPTHPVPVFACYFLSLPTLIPSPLLRQTSMDHLSSSVLTIPSSYLRYSLLFLLPNSIRTFLTPC